MVFKKISRSGRKDDKAKVKAKAMETLRIRNNLGKAA